MFRQDVDRQPVYSSTLPTNGRTLCDRFRKAIQQSVRYRISTFSSQKGREPAQGPYLPDSIIQTDAPPLRPAPPLPGGLQPMRRPTTRNSNVTQRPPQHLQEATATIRYDSEWFIPSPPKPAQHVAIPFDVEILAKIELAGGFDTPGSQESFAPPEVTHIGFELGTPSFGCSFSPMPYQSSAITLTKPGPDAAHSPIGSLLQVPSQRPVLPETPSFTGSPDEILLPPERPHGKHASHAPPATYQPFDALQPPTLPSSGSSNREQEQRVRGAVVETSSSVTDDSEDDESLGQHHTVELPAEQEALDPPESLPDYDQSPMGAEFVSDGKKRLNVLLSIHSSTESSDPPVLPRKIPASTVPISPIPASTVPISPSLAMSPSDAYSEFHRQKRAAEVAQWGQDMPQMSGSDAFLPTLVRTGATAPTAPNTPLPCKTMFKIPMPTENDPVTRFGITNSFLPNTNHTRVQLPSKTFQNQRDTVDEEMNQSTSGPCSACSESSDADFADESSWTSALPRVKTAGRRTKQQSKALPSIASTDLTAEQGKAATRSSGFTALANESGRLGNAYKRGFTRQEIVGWLQQIQTSG